MALTNDAGGVVDLAAPERFRVGPARELRHHRCRPGGELALSSGSTLTNEAKVTRGHIDAITGVVSGISGPGESLDGTLAVTTSARPALGRPTSLSMGQ